MSHFAKIEDGLVTTVIVAEQEFVDGQEGTWIQTSYNTRGGKHYDQDGNEDSITPLRKNYAGIGYTYDPTRNAFYAPKPYMSWTLNNTTCLWESPVAYPSDGKMYSWNEETIAWDLVEE
tara:strand:+ start:3569 stop:3925 length:357 start_codon:yes stop_codon:yes gene_type:complete